MMRFTLCLRSLGVATFLLFLGGCATVPRESGFPDVEKSVSERAQLRVHWNQGTSADKEVAKQVSATLAKELSADDAVQIALLNNQDLQAVYEDLGVAQAELVEAGMLKNPIFDGAIKFVEGGGRPKIELSVAQNFLEVFQIPLRKRIAGAQFEAAKLRVTSAVLDLAGQTRSAFYSYQAARRTLELRQTVSQAEEASYDLAKRLHAAGNITALALANERALFEQGKLDLASAEVDVAEAKERLNMLMGLWGDQLSWKAAERLPELPESEQPMDALESKAVASSLELGVSRQQIEVSARRLGLSETYGLIPEATVGAGYERTEEANSELGPTISLPLPIFNQGQPAVAAAQAELRRARAQYASAAIKLRANVRAGRVRLNAARARAAYIKAVILPLRRQIVERTQLEYNGMLASPFQLLQVKQQEIDAGAMYIRSLRDYWLARSELDQILAGGPAGGSRGPGETSRAPGITSSTSGAHP